MSLINHKQGEWGPFSPGIIVLSSMISMNNFFIQGLLPASDLEEFLYNPRTYSNLEELGCPAEVLNLFKQGMVFNDIHEIDPALALKSVEQVNQECLNLLLSVFKK